MQERPTKGYKAVIRYNEFRWYVLEMDIPEEATLVDSGNGFYRTDKVIPRRFLSTKCNSDIIDKSAHSWFSIDFEYTPGVLATSRLDLNRHTDCAAGIHFFETFDQAKNWGNANFGMPAAM